VTSLLSRYEHQAKTSEAKVLCSLRPNAVLLPQVIPSDYSSMVMELLSFYTPPFETEEQRWLHSLCPVHPLHAYIDRKQNVCFCDQLFVCFVNPARGKALSRQRLSHWIVEAITAAGFSLHLMELIQPGAWQRHGPCLEEFLLMIYLLWPVGHHHKLLFGSTAWM